MEDTHMTINRRVILGVGIAATLLPNFVHAQTDQVKASMAALKDKTAKLGPANVEGTNLQFGTTKMNNSFEVVDETVKEHGGTATLFMKSGNDYVRVATNVKKDDGSRAVGTVLDPNGPVFPMIQKGEAYYGDATILGKLYTTGYEPIRDASGKVIGIYYVGFLK
jgi:hypothetical protein